MLQNLEHDSVIVNIRCEGPHAITSSPRQHMIYANTSVGNNIPLQGLNGTFVQPRQATSVTAVIPINGNYYLTMSGLPYQVGPIR